MKKSDKLVVAVCLDEINATVRRVGKPLTRKMYLMARRWYNCQQEWLMQLRYKGRTDRFPKHKAGKVIEEVKEVRIPEGRLIEIFTF